MNRDENTTDKIPIKVMGKATGAKELGADKMARNTARFDADAPRLRKPLIVALARKLLIALWRLVHEGVVPDGVVLRPA